MFQKITHFFKRLFTREKNAEDVKCDSFVIGWIYYYSSKEELSVILKKGGINNSVGEWAIELTDYPSIFKIAYVGNLSPEEPFDIEGDGYNVEIETVTSWCKKLSDVLKHNNVFHEIVHLNHEEDEIAEFIFLSEQKH